MRLNLFQRIKLVKRINKNNKKCIILTGSKTQDIKLYGYTEEDVEEVFNILKEHRKRFFKKLKYNEHYAKYK